MDEATDATAALAICGHSGAGKTTLLEALVPALRARGWRIAVQKRTHHDVAVDVVGKDSDRLFRAGATVGLEARGQTFVRTATDDGDRTWRRQLRRLAADHDLVLVEGHKETPLPKVWLLGPGERAIPPGVTGVLAVLGRDEPRLAATVAECERRLAQVRVARPLYGALVLDRDHDPASVTAGLAVLAGAAARVVVVGAGVDASVPRLPPVPERGARGRAHALAALRWAPHAAWLIARPGPQLTPAVVAALLARRGPGCWMIGGAADGAPALYEPQARELLEDGERIDGDLARADRERADGDDVAVSSPASRRRRADARREARA